MHKVIINEYNRCKKQYEKDRQTSKFSDKFYRKGLQDNLYNKTEYESLCNIFLE